MNQETLVSVVIPTYRRSNLLSRAIDSVLEQSYKTLEVIVVDDNDAHSNYRVDTEKVMEKYSNHKNVIYIKHLKNLNGSAARNTGIKYAKGHYITFLDDDDYYLARKIELQVNRLENLGEEWGACYTRFIRMKNGKLLDKGIENREGTLVGEILKGSFYISAGSNIMVKKSIIEKVGGFNENFKRRQDLEFLVKVNSISKIAAVKEHCLIINKDDQSNRLKAEDLESNLLQFLEYFSTYIENLPKNDRIKIVQVNMLHRIRFLLGNKQFIEAFKQMKTQNISASLIIRYFFYLVNRRVFKLCYGFKI